MNEPRRLRHGNLALDLSTLPRCGACTRVGTPCRRACSLRNGRCRMHGGLSTGPRTIAGRRRVIEANTTQPPPPGASATSAA